MNMNLTGEEQYRLYGAVSDKTTIELLDAFSQFEKFDGIEGTLKEVAGCFPQEDVLSSQITSLHNLLGNVRGQNRDTLGNIIDQLIEVRRELYNDADHGRDLLRGVGES